MRWNRKQLREHVAAETAELNKTIDRNQTAAATEMKKKLEAADQKQGEAWLSGLIIGLFLGGVAATATGLIVHHFGAFNRATGGGFWQWLGF